MADSNALAAVKADIIRKNRYTFAQGEDVVAFANNHLMGTWAKDQTADCVVVTSEAMIRIEAGQVNLRIPSAGVVGVWLTQFSPVSRMELHIGILDGRTIRILIRTEKDAKKIARRMLEWSKTGYSARYVAAHNLEKAAVEAEAAAASEGKDQTIGHGRARLRGTLAGHMVSGTPVWIDRNYVFAAIPTAMEGGTLLRLPHILKKTENGNSGQIIILEAPAHLFVIFERPPESDDVLDRSGGLAGSLPRMGWRPMAGPAPKVLGPRYGGRKMNVYFMTVNPAGEVRLPPLSTPHTCMAVVAKFAPSPNQPLPPPPQAAMEIAPPPKALVATEGEGEGEGKVEEKRGGEVKEEGEDDGTEAGVKAGEELISRLAPKPKHLLDGTLSGLQAAGGGILVGLGCLCYAPYAGARDGGVAGFAKGLATGIAGAVVAPVAGVTVGVGQIIRGAAATPSAVSAGMEGKVWDKKKGEWVRPEPYDMMEHFYRVKRKALEQGEGKEEDISGAKRAKKQVKETKLYELIGVPVDATQSQIRKSYYKEALKSHPDKNPNDPEANERFQQLSRAYQVLSNPQLRDAYDRHGESGTEAVQLDMVSATAVFFSTLFGSEEFEPFLGEFQISSRLGKLLGEAVQGGGISEEHQKDILNAEAEAEQERQVRCAVHTMKVIEPYVCGNQEAFILHMRGVVASLIKAPFGVRLVQAMGEAYVTASEIYLGKNSFLGFKGTVAATRKSVVKLKKRLMLARQGYRAYRAAEGVARMADTDGAFKLTDATVEAKIIGINGPQVTRLVKLESQKFKYTELVFDFPITRFKLVKQLSETVPEEGKNFGADGNRLWCDRGCRGIFLVEVTRSESDPVKAATAAAAAAAESVRESSPKAEEKPSEDHSSREDGKTEGKEDQGDKEGMTEARARASQRELEGALPVFLEAMWAFTELDVAETIHGICSKLFSDEGVDKGTRRARAKAVKALGTLLLHSARLGLGSAGIVATKEAKAAAGEFTAEDAKGHFMKAMTVALQKAQAEAEEKDQKK